MAVCFLLHFPASHLDWPLASTLPCGAPTFLNADAKANDVATTQLTRATLVPYLSRSETLPPLTEPEESGCLYRESALARRVWAPPLERQLSR